MSKQDLLIQYEIVIDKMLKLDIQNEDERLLSLLLQSEEVQAKMMEYGKEEAVDSEQIKRVNEKLSQVMLHVQTYMDQIRVNIDDTFNHRVTEGKKKIAYQKIKNMQQGTQGYYFDRKK